MQKLIAINQTEYNVIKLALTTIEHAISQVPKEKYTQCGIINKSLEKINMIIE